MAEYIDRFIIGGLVDSHNNVHYEDIKAIPTADVVERSEYEKVLEENKALKRIISDKVNEDLKCAFEIKELRSKIDKAIKEMEINIKCNTDPKTGKVNILGQGQIMMLDILKRNIGE